MSTKVLDDFSGSRYPFCLMIELTNACFNFDETPVLKSIDLQIRPGEFAAIVGANGSGKTTLARCLNGLLVPQTGLVSVEGKHTAHSEDLPFIRQTVGMVFQNPDDQLATTTVESELAFGLENIAVPPDEMRIRVERALLDFGLAPYRNTPPHHLSGGERQRLAIAATLIMRPRYIVLDEPTALLDPQHRQQVIDLLQTLRQQDGIATILITQIPEEAANAERIIALEDGKIFLDESPSDVFSDLQRLEKVGLEAPFARRLSAICPQPFTAVTEDQFINSWPPCSLAPVSCISATTEPNKTKQTMLEAQSVSHVYGQSQPHEKQSLFQVSARFSAGEIHAIIGASGSGKTTFAQHLNGLLKPSSGRILLDGKDIQSQLPIHTHQRVGIVFQFPESQLFAETVEQDVSFGPRNVGHAEERVDALVNEALSWVDLPLKTFGQRPPLSLSGGEKRRVALAGVLAMDPDVLVLDEPTAGLDPKTTRSFCTLLQRLAGEGKTIVIITHDMDIVALLADNTTILNAGKVVLQGTTRSTLTHPDLTQLSHLHPPTATQFALRLGAHSENRLQLPLTLEELCSVL